MSSKNLVRALRAASKQKIPSQSFQKRSFVSTVVTRPAVVANARAAFAGPTQQQTRGVKTIDFAGTKEQVFGMNSMHYLQGWELIDC